MGEEYHLFGKTFDQQVETAGADILNLDMSPNTRIAAEVVFEPLPGGIRVTARDADHRVLWGFIGSHGILGQIHCPVAVYDRLAELLTRELEKIGSSSFPDSGDVVGEANRAILALEATVANLKKSLQVKKVTEATRIRADKIRRSVIDANRQILLDMGAGFPGRRDGEPNEEGAPGEMSGAGAADRMNAQ